MKKKEAILVELTNENYDIESIAEKTKIRPIRVINIINNQILRKKLEGELIKKETEFIPGEVTKKYQKNLIINRIYLVLGIIALTIIDWPVPFLISLYWTQYPLVNKDIYLLVAGILALLLIIGAILSIIVVDNKLGKIAAILHWISCGIGVLGGIVAYIVYLRLYLAGWSH